MKCSQTNVNTTNYINDDCVIPNNKNAFSLLSAFLQLPKLLEISYCNVVFLREYYVTEVISTGQNHHAPVIYQNWG